MINLTANDAERLEISSADLSSRHYKRRRRERSDGAKRHQNYRKFHFLEFC
jgi:hypothetical protein